MLGIYILIFTICAINPADRSVWWAENIPVLIPVVILILTFRKFRFSNTSYFFMTFFFCIHTIGGHYTFENVPFDYGNSILNYLNFDFIFPEGRNNYDRIAHFLIGILAYPVAEIFLRKKWVSNFKVAIFVGIMVIGFWGALYEIIETIYAVVCGGEQAASFLGSQGDIWDAQKDMLLDISGAVMISMLFYWNYRKLKN
ncbi:DUF2238 domain-containing protein [Candidatus Gracilibacteria bacterium]|nr:DUF2238 domain-containing protein [Candidatus Gracilibacteria bacterium]